MILTPYFHNHLIGHVVLIASHVACASLAISLLPGPSFSQLIFCLSHSIQEVSDRPICSCTAVS